MGKKLDALLGRGFKTGKFKATVALAISRLAVLKNQRQARCSIARSDVVEFLNNTNHDRALLRVEQVIKEQNMLDVFVLLEGYCHLLLERVNLLQHEKICPEELNEAVSTLIYASTRCGEFPELQEIRAIFTSRFGKEFAARAVELRNNCGVNPKIIQKLSTRMPSLENKMKMLKEIASDNNIDLPVEDSVPDTPMENKELGQHENPMPGVLSPSRVLHQEENKPIHPDVIERGVGRKYKDVADAAQAAFESAAYAARAARAAVELSRSESTDPDDPSTPNRRPTKRMSMKAKLQTRDKDSQEDELIITEAKFEKIHPVQNVKFEAKDGDLRAEKGTEFRRSVSGSSSDSYDGNVKGFVGVFGNGDGEIKSGDVVFDDSDDGEYEQKKRWNELETGNYPSQFAEEKNQNAEPLNINRRPISVRTRWAHGR
ncbi:hypothetical protein DH2020_049816 [Rehmannia glutinosa]|uniref:IST1-like protein n=1 Tax=Rehmannia glutinosa TaxID=99300 RepID=A0ABR0U1Z9_REHGL